MVHRMLTAVVVALGLTAPAAAAEISYVRDVKPFLAKYCVECHTSAKPQGGVALDNYQALIKGNDPVVRPGQPDKSDLVKVLAGGRKAMPPRLYAHRPTPAEIALVRAWVVAGARDDSDAGPPPPKD
jgi:mono/diheme cytochrome c family protein